MILHAALFPCGIAVTIIDVKAIPFTAATLDKLVILHKLAAVVGGNTPELFSEIRRFPFQPVYGPPYRLRSPIRQLDDDFLTAPALRQSKQHTFSALSADH